MTKYCESCHTANKNYARYCKGCAGVFSGVVTPAHTSGRSFVADYPARAMRAERPTQVLAVPPIPVSLPASPSSIRAKNLLLLLFRLAIVLLFAAVLVRQWSRIVERDSTPAPSPRDVIAQVQQKVSEPDGVAASHSPAPVEPLPSPPELPAEVSSTSQLEPVEPAPASAVSVAQLASEPEASREAVV
ncbi:MAG TPA: hypothetical protein VEP93_13360, partial [Variovorax sp.]|nr:hypothetical protein [Variovorax sp.]